MASSADASAPEHTTLLVKNPYAVEKGGVSKLSGLHHGHKGSAAASLSSGGSGSAAAAAAQSSSPASTGPRTVSTAFKMALFFSIVAWSTSAALIVRYSQGVLKERYSIVGSVVVTEFIKWGLSTLAVCRDQRWSVPDTMRRCTTIMWSSLPMAIPAVVYLVQNTLNYVALKSIPSATHAILVQLKLLTTAIFAVLILRKQIFFYQWRALFLLFIGIVLVQWPTTQSSGSQQAAAAGTALGSGMGDDGSGGGVWALSARDLVARYGGVMAATTQAALSGFSGVYTEWRLKGRGSFTLWENNFQLCFYSILFGAFSLLMSTSDMTMIMERGFFYGYSGYTWTCIALNSWGGLMVAAILLYCDNILKNFASSVSILATSVLGFMLYGEPQFTINFFCGACVLISAIFIYNEDIIALAGHMQQTRREAEEQQKHGGAMLPMRHSRPSWTQRTTRTRRRSTAARTTTRTRRRRRRTATNRRSRRRACSTRAPARRSRAVRSRACARKPSRRAPGERSGRCRRTTRTAAAPPRAASA